MRYRSWDENKKYQLFLHQSLTKKKLSQEEYTSLTKLNEDEVLFIFSLNKREMLLMLRKIGFIFLVSEALLSEKRSNYIRQSRNILNNKEILWSKTVIISNVSDDMVNNIDVVELGIEVLSIYSEKIAVAISCRLGYTTPSRSLSVDNKPRLTYLIMMIKKGLKK
ncbi:hypothetical protein EJ063_07575 [Vibrio aquaticus]|uniref:Uncharacterized protein n=1 Tax=Vibrio aquaticus TaxID=2496559 RepID=A0A3S0Q2G1_9VIBR|nr:hypothetical protein [Vibrio aquaticus]RTZ16645.1 hypothetical protein EJ063_07575 [Vibrio aquaticus]